MKKTAAVLGFIFFAFSLSGFSQENAVTNHNSLKLKLQSGVFQDIAVDNVSTLEATIIDLQTGVKIHKIVTGSKVKELLSSIDFENPFQVNGALGCVRIGEMTLTFKEGTVPAEFQPREFGLMCRLVYDKAFKTRADSVLYRTSRMLGREWLEQ